MRKQRFLFAVAPFLAVALLFMACTPPVENTEEGKSGTSALPVISIHPTSFDYVGDAEIEELTVKAEVKDGGTLTYQWYENDKFSNTGGTAIRNAESETYTPQSKPQSFYYVVVTNTKEGANPRKNTSNPARIRVLDEEEAAPTVTVNITNTNRQYVRGFGGMSNAFGINGDNPPRYMELKDIETMFNPDTGLGFNILRIMLWYQPLENVISGQVEPQMNNQITYLEAVKRVNKYGGYVLASPWSPPPEWKVNESEKGTAPSYLLDTHYRDYAEYLKNYARAMAGYGAPIYAISIQNEPSFPASYAGCEWTSQQQVDFFKTTGVGKFMTGIKGWGGGKELASVKIMSGEAHQNVTWNDAAKNDPVSHAAIDIYAFHTYGNHSNAYTAVQADNATNRKEVWMTEWNINSGSAETYPQDSTWNFVWLFANALDNDVRCDSVNAFVWWYLKRFYCFIGDGSYTTVNNEVQPRGYIMSHYAKYATDTVRVSATVNNHPAGGNVSDLSITGYNSTTIKVKASAFRRKANPTTYWEQQVKKQEDSISLVIYDSRTAAGEEGADIRVSLPTDFGEAKYASAIISDSTGKRHAPHLVVLAGDGKTADFNLPANSIVSIKFSK